MIVLPPWAVPNGAGVSFVDYGATLRGPNGAALRADRLGSHYRVGFRFPVFGDAAQARVIVSRLVRAKRQGLRLDYPLSCPQPLRDALVDGAGQAGTSLSVRGLSQGMIVREGFWLSIEAASGQHYLHNAAAEVIADASGRATLTLSEMLRAPFPDGAKVHLVRPMVEGLVDGDEQAWEVGVEGEVGIEFTVEEAG